MAAFSRHSLKLRPTVLTRSLPWVGAAVLGVGLFLLVATMPGAMLESLLRTSGIAALTSTAQSPLGGPPARLLVGLGAGGAAAMLGWAVLYLLFGPGGSLVSVKPRVDRVQAVRRGDAHPDAPPRRPLSAAHELAAPPVPVVAVQPLPADLDTPLASFDPHSILPVPREAVRPVPALVSVPAPILAPTERLETVMPSRDPAPADPPSVEALLRRLEQAPERRVRVVR